jgi:uncharacterized membrane protein YqjE
MAGDTMRFRNPAGHAGLLRNLLSLASALAGFLESRIGLFAKESKTALAQILALVACLAVAAVLALFGYVFLIVSAIAGVAHALQTSWIWITLAAAGVHFVLALACLLIARSRMNKPMLEATIAELKKDREWLKDLETKSRSAS